MTAYRDTSSKDSSEQLPSRPLLVHTCSIGYSGTMSRTTAFFAYGSLLWEHSLPFVTARSPAVLHGFRRRLCLYSWAYRGTRDNPGLVLGLDAHAASACIGAALHVNRSDEEAALKYFDERELILGIYSRQRVTLNTAAGSGSELVMSAHAYIAVPTHEQYCGELSVAHAAELVATGVGTRGTALEYLTNTVAALRQASVREPGLERVLHEANVLRRHHGQQS